jgi:hypothetical protein
LDPFLQHLPGFSLSRCLAHLAGDTPATATLDRSQIDISLPVQGEVSLNRAALCWTRYFKSDVLGFRSNHVTVMAVSFRFAADSAFADSGAALTSRYRV